MIENSRSCALSLASALACLSLAACDHYDRGTDSNAVGSLGAAGAGNNVGAAIPGAGAPGAATGSSTREGNPATGGLVMGGASTGTSGASDGPLDASSGVEVDSGASTGGAGGVPAAGGSGGSGSVVTLTSGPCDVYAASNTPCVAAYSMVRKLSGNYAGPLYQVRRGGPNPNTGTGGVTQDIGVLPDGFADAAAQDAFCGNQICTVSVLYDQSGRGNHLTVAPAGCYMGTASEDDYESRATARALTVGGHRVYGLYMNPHEGYRDNTTAGMPTGTQSQGVYALVDGKRSGCCCCFDFGNGSTDNCNGPTGLMNALYFGTGYWGRGAGNGPWFLGDFEAGVWAGGNGASNAVNNNSPSMTMDFAFGVLKTDANTYALRMGDGQNGNLTTAYNGAAPARWQLQGGIILGIGGDNSNSSFGTFYEGAITAGRPSDATEDAVLRNVQAARYGQ